MDLLTHSVNVPAEREKLRRLRDEINASAQQRLARQRKHTARGFLPDLPALAPKGQPRHGGAPAGALRPGADMEISPAAALVREAQAGDCGCRCGSGCVGCEGVKP